MADPIFEDRRLAEVYDPLDPDRGDLEAYRALVHEVGARSVLDIGCGTGTLACLLAQEGIDVTGVDPAAASLEVAHAKPGALAVRWVHGDATVLEEVRVDLALMTGNVAQVFVEDDDWEETLRATRRALRQGGRFAFETRDPARQAWLLWNRSTSYQRTEVEGVGTVESWVDLLEAAGDLVSFRWTFVFSSDGAVITSDSTVRFRTLEQLTASLACAGFDVDEVRDAPDRPGLEWVFLATAR